MMRSGAACILTIASLLLSVAPGDLAANDLFPTRTPPTSISITTEPVQLEEATYRFAVVLSAYRVVDGIPQLTVSTTITKIAEGTQVQFSAIILQVATDSSSIRLKADGEEFVLEAAYRDPLDGGMQPRQVTTTFGQMFLGDKVGLTARLMD